MRRRRSLSSASETFTWNGRIATLSVVDCRVARATVDWVMAFSFARRGCKARTGETRSSAVEARGGTSAAARCPRARETSDRVFRARFCDHVGASGAGVLLGDARKMVAAPRARRVRADVRGDDRLG